MDAAFPRADSTMDPYILVVEDDAALQWMIAAFLRNEGYRVETTGTTQQALSAILRERPKLVLLDMDLPGIHGSQLVQALRAREITLPIVVMTAARNAREWAEQIGAAAYVSKPLSLPMLLRRINSVAA
jgi:DNA-binding response OmpR family regulator